MVGKVLHPAVGSGTVPVFDTFRNFDNGAGKELNGRLAPFLVPAAAGHANQNLYLFVVDMPVVAAAGLEAYVGLAAFHQGQVTVACKVLCVGKGGIGIVVHFYADNSAHDLLVNLRLHILSVQESLEGSPAGRTLEGGELTIGLAMLPAIRPGSLLRRQSARCQGRDRKRRRTP